MRGWLWKEKSDDFGYKEESFRVIINTRNLCDIGEGVTLL